MEALSALIAGSFIGAVLGFIGAGGAMVSVPILNRLFDYPIHDATIAALLIVIFAALSGLYGRFKRGEVLPKQALTISAIGIVTNVGGALVAKDISDSIIKFGFSIILTLAGISMIKKHHYEEEKPIGLTQLILLALIMGSLTGIFGIGGGFIVIPVLVRGFHIPIHKAAGTSLLVIAANSTISLLAHSSKWGDIPWKVPVLMSISAIVIANIAGRLVKRVPQAVLQKIFAILLFVVAATTFI